MKPTHLLGYVVTGAVVFVAGYAVGGGSDVVASLRKQPASMLTVGLAGANAALSTGRMTVESGRLVISKSLPLKGGACAAELQSLRNAADVRYDKTGVKIAPSYLSKHFLPAEEQSSTDPSVLARRNAIDDVTIVRMIAPGGGVACEGPLVMK